MRASQTAAPPGPSEDEVAVGLHRGLRHRLAARAGRPDGGLPVVEDEVPVGLEHELELARGRVQALLRREGVGRPEGVGAAGGRPERRAGASSESPAACPRSRRSRRPAGSASRRACRPSATPTPSPAARAGRGSRPPASRRSSRLFPAVPDVHTGTPSRARTRSPSAWSVSVSGRVLAVSDAPGKSASVARRRSPAGGGPFGHRPGLPHHALVGPVDDEVAVILHDQARAAVPVGLRLPHDRPVPTSTRFPPARISACVAPFPAVPDDHSFSAPGLEQHEVAVGLHDERHRPRGRVQPVAGGEGLARTQNVGHRGHRLTRRTAGVNPARAPVRLGLEAGRSPGVTPESTFTIGLWMQLNLGGVAARWRATTGSSAAAGAWRSTEGGDRSAQGERNREWKHDRGGREQRRRHSCSTETSASAGASSALPTRCRESRPVRRTRRQTTPPDWRIACGYVGKGHRRQGVAAAGLAGALDLIAGSAEEPWRDTRRTPLWCPPASCSTGLCRPREVGFIRDRRIGKHRWVMTTVVEPTS